MTNPIDDFTKEINTLIGDAHELLANTIERTKASDERAKQQGVDWSERHRLHVLLEAAESTQKYLPNAVVAPWFVAELKHVLEIVRRWKDKLSWNDIEPSLASPSHFSHTIGKLTIAEFQQKQGHKVEIIPRGSTSSPDLRLQAIGGTEDWVNIECYQPQPLNGRLVTISKRSARKIVKASMKKARVQLGNQIPGILAVFGYNQSRENIDNLRFIFHKRMQKTERANLGGIMLMILTMLYEHKNGKETFRPIAHMEFVRNPSYFGRVEIKDEVRKDAPGLIRYPIVDIDTDTFLSIRNGELRISNFTELIGRKAEPRIKRLKTSVKTVQLSEVKKLDRQKCVLMQRKHQNGVPLFEGEGNINYVCLHCQKPIAEAIWKFSISNIVTKCPSCDLYNKFPSIDTSNLSIKGRIGFLIGKYEFQGREKIKLKRGISFVGLQRAPTNIEKHS